MNGLWKRRIPALLMALVLIVSLMPAALATSNDDTGSAKASEQTEGGAGSTGSNGNEGGSGTGTEGGGTENPDPTPPSCPPHTFGDWVTTVPAKCNETGVETRTCTICKAETEERTIPATGKHSYEWKVTQTATCSADGSREGVCSVCGDKTSEVIPADKSAHDWGNWEIVTPASCGVKGSQQRVCKINSGHTETKEIEATNKHTDADKDNKCDVCGQTVHLSHTFSTSWSSDANQHWHACTYTGCTERNSVANHSDTKNNTTNANAADGLCDVCGYRVGTAATYTVTYYVPTSTGGQSATVEKVVSGSRPTGVPSPRSTFTANNTTYSFYRWSKTSGNPWYLYSSTSQASVTPSSTAVTGNVTYYALYTADSKSTDITITAAAGKSTDFDITDFRKVYQTEYSGDPSFVTFSVSRNNYENFAGKVYSGSSELSRNELTSSDGFNYSSRDLGSLSFHADKNARNNSTLEISFTIYGGTNDRNRVNGTLILKVGAGSSTKGDIEYEVAPGKTVTVKSRDFRDYLREEYKGEELSYVRFDSTSFSGGTFYCKLYNSSTEDSFSSGSKLSKEYFYYDPARNQYDLGELSFTASSSFKSEVSIGFTVYSAENSRHYVNGTLLITSTSKSAKGDIEYEVAPGKTVDLKRNDFRDFLREEEGKSATVDYVQFKRPSSTSIFDNGKLYYDYGGGSSEITLTRSNITSYKFYYSPGRNDYDLDELTFAADSGFKNEITLEFTVYGTGSNESASGSLVIASTSKSSSSSGDISYKVTPGGSKTVAINDFRTLLRKEYSGATVDYVRFKNPSSSVFTNGTLYYDYKGGSTEETLGATRLSSYKFYYSPGRNDYDLAKLTFAAGNSFKDSITLSFTVYGTRDDEELDGTLVFTSDGTAPAASSSYVGSIRYNTTAGTNVQIKADDINRYVRKSLSSTLQYVTLTGVPATGGLYYNYYSASQYGTTSRLQITSANRSGMSFYFNPSSTSQYALTELTYVPSGSNYCASIPFTAYADGSRSVNGTILISVTQQLVPEIYGVTTKGTAVSFSSNSFYNAVLNATGSTLYSIQLLSLPSSTAGTVYLGSGTSTRAATNVQYTYASGANSISQLRFAPSASYTGTVEIPYVALNSSGTALASGVFALGVVSAKKEFKDVGNTVWCYKYVTELSDANVIGGYNDGTFKYTATLSYGAALKLIMLAAGYPAQAPTGKNVFSGYLDKARADGLITRSNVNLNGPITRLQVATLAAGALKLNTSGLSTVKPFTDTSDLNVQALNAAGIVEGYFDKDKGTSTYRPNANLNRGQMSAIVWRMQNYRKS